MDKLSYSDLFDFSDKSELEKARKAIESLELEYGTLSKHLTEDSGKIAAAIGTVTEALKLNEKYLKGLNITTAEHQQKAVQLAQSVEAEVTVLAQLTKAQKDAAAAQKAYEKTVKEMKREMDALTVKLEQAKKAADPTKIKALKTEIGNTTDQAKMLTTAAGALNEELAEQGKQAKGATEKIKAQAGSIAELRERVSAAKKEYEGMGKEIDPIAKSDALENYAKLKKELDEISKSTNVAVKTNGLSQGSYLELSAEVNKLNKELREMPDVFGANKEAAEALQKTIYDKTQTLKDFDKATNQSWRNVGNYGDAFREAADAAGIFGPQIQALQGIQQAFNATLAAVAPSLEGTGAAFKKAAIGSISFSEAMKIVRLALISTGIGAIVVAIGGLIAYFMKTEEGAEKLERAMAGLGAAFDVIVGAAASVGKTLMGIFENPKQALVDFSNFLVGNFMNRIKAIGVLFRALKRGDLNEFSNGLFQLTLGVEDVGGKVERLGQRAAGLAKQAMAAANAMAELEGRFQNVEDAEREFGVQAEKTKLEIDRLILTAKDRSQSEGQRVNNLKKAGQLEEHLLAQELKFANERANILKAQNALREKAGTLRDDDAQAEQDAIKKTVELRGQSALLQQKIANRLSVLNTDLAEEARKAEVDRLKAEEISLKLRLLQVAEHSKEELEIKKKLVDVAGKIEIAGETHTKNEVALIRAQGQLDKKKLDTEFFEWQKAEAERQLKEAEENRKKQIEAEFRAIEAGGQARIAQQDSLYGSELNALMGALTNKEITFEEYEKRRTALGQKYNRQALVDEILLLDQKAHTAELTAEELLEVERNLMDKRRELYQRDVEDAEEAERKKLEKRVALIQAAQDIATEAADAAFEFMNYGLERDMQALELQHENEVRLAGDNAEAKKQADESYHRRKAELEIKAAKREKAAALFSIAINTAAAVASVLSTGGGTRYADFGISAGLLSAFVIAQGALQAALVLSKPLPQYFKGRKGGPAELAVVDEKGPEIIERKGQFFMGADAGPRLTYLGAGDKVYTALETERLLADIMAGDESNKHLGTLHGTTKALGGIVQPVNQHAVELKMARQMGRYFNRLEQVIKNKKEVKLNITKEGIDLLVKQGNVWNNYVNNRYDV